MARIVILSPFAPPADGIGEHTRNLVNAFVQEGQECIIIAPESGSNQALKFIGFRSGDKTVQVPVLRVLGPFGSQRAWRELRRFEPDLIYTQFAISSFGSSIFSLLSVLRKAQKQKLQCISGFHESAREFNILGPISRMIYRAGAKSTNQAISFSTAGFDALTASGLFANEGRVWKLPHGTSEPQALPEDLIASVRLKYHLEKPTILVLGFVHPDKGSDILLDAAQAISAGQRGEVRFLFAGMPRKSRGIFRVMGRADVKYDKALRKQSANELKTLDISFAPYVPDADVVALLKEAAMVVLPYRRSTQSGIANLALASGALIIASDLPGLKSDLGDCAEYFSGSPQDLAEVIKSRLSEGCTLENLELRAKSMQRARSQSYRRVATEILTIAGVCP